MNEKFKKTVIGCAFAFLVCVIAVQSVAHNIAVRRADTAIDTLTEQLTDAQCRLTLYRAEIKAGRDTIAECSGSVGRIADGLESQSGELSDIIGNLKQVRTEIEKMENAFNMFYDKYGSDNNDSDIFMEEVK